MKNRKKNTKLILLLLLVCITLGYAALRTGLNINGTTNVSSASWNVHFENYQMSNATNITPTTEPSISGTTTTSISYEVDLDVPGDLYEFSVEVVNGGSIDALISLVSKYNGSEIGPSNPVPAYIEYTVTDGNGDPIVDGHRLNHGNREIVKVFVKYKDNDPSILPSSSTTLAFDIEIEATQAPKPQPDPGFFTVGFWNFNTGNYGKLFIGRSLQEGTGRFQTVAEVLADHAGDYPQPHYLKYELGPGTDVCEYNENYEEGEEGYYYNCGEYKDLNDCESEDWRMCTTRNAEDVITKMYLGYYIDNAMKEFLKKNQCGEYNPEYAEDWNACITRIDNLVNGTYYFRGPELNGTATSQEVFLENKEILKTMFNYSVQPDVCTSASSSFTCKLRDSGSNEDVYIVVDQSSVKAYGYSQCFTYYDDGYSECWEG